jgi:hypothetical protein
MLKSKKHLKYSRALTDLIVSLRSLKTMPFKNCTPQVQVVGLLCQTAKKDSRHELLRRVAAGGGVFQSENGLKIHLPAANLNDVANQADDLLEVVLNKKYDVCIFTHVQWNA